ncbi:MAG: hypothetical protein WCV67_09685 [Victivallaceae bacterium]|jgi:hypothetical protein
MFNSKYYLIVIVVAFVFLAGSVGIQVLEMKEYNLFHSLSGRFLKKGEAAATAEAPAAKKTEATPAAKKAEAAPAAPADKK